MSGSSYDNIPAAVRAQWAQMTNFENPPTHPAVIIPLTIILGVMVVIVVAARIWVRVFLQRNVDFSDWLIFITTIPTLIFLAMVSLGVTSYGYDRHMYDVHTPHLIVALKLYFVGYIAYFMISGLIRISILFFYLRLANRDLNKLFVRSVWGLIIFTTLYMVSFSVAVVFTCSPVESFWMRVDPNWGKDHSYHCYNEGVKFMLSSAVSAMDLAVALLPTALFWNLRLPRRQKIAIWSLFAVGCTTAIASLIRIYYVYLDFYQSYDITWWGFYLWLWTEIELAVATICASAPSLKAIFKHFFESDAEQSRTETISRNGREARQTVVGISSLKDNTRHPSVFDIDMVALKDHAWENYGYVDDEEQARGTIVATTKMPSSSDNSGNVEYMSDQTRACNGDMVIRVRTTLSAAEA